MVNMKKEKSIEDVRAYVKRVAEWPYSTFHQYVEQGIYLPNWCGDITISVGSDE